VIALKSGHTHTCRSFTVDELKAKPGWGAAQHMWYMKELNQFIAHKLLPSKSQGVGSIKRQLKAKRAEAAHQHANRGSRPAMAASQPDLTGATGQLARHEQTALLQAAAATLLDAEHISSFGLSKSAPAEAKATAEQADESVYHRASGLSTAVLAENAATAEQADESVYHRASVLSTAVLAENAATAEQADESVYHRASGLSTAVLAENAATAEQADESVYHRASVLSTAVLAENAATAEQTEESVYHRALLQVVPSSVLPAHHTARVADSAAVESNLVSRFTALLQQQIPAEQLADLHEDTTPPFKQQAVNVLGVKRSQAFGTPQYSSRSLLQEGEEEEEAVNMLGEEEARVAVADEVGEVYLYAAEDLTRIAPLWWNYTKQMRVFHETYAKVCRHLQCEFMCQPYVPCIMLTTTQCIADANLL